MNCCSVGLPDIYQVIRRFTCLIGLDKKESGYFLPITIFLLTVFFKFVFAEIVNLS